MRKITLLFTFLIIAGALSAQTAFFTVAPKSYGGAFSSKGAFTTCWVEKANGEFIKTLEMKVDLNGIDILVSYFTEWVSSTGWTAGAEIDGVTGATSVSLGSKQFIWDCRDANGAFVPEGNYRIYYEFTEGDDPKDENITSRFTFVEFTKGPNDQNVIGDPEENFTKREIRYRANITSINDVEESKKNLSVYPNPFRSATEISILGMENKGKMISVYDMTGKLIKSSNTTDDKIVIDGSDFHNGIYFVKVTGENGVVYTRRIIKN